MKTANEIKFNYGNIETQILELQKLRDRAVTCSNMKFSMPLSKGDAKDVLIDAHGAMTSFAGSVAIMLKDIIEDLNYAKDRMKMEDDSNATKLRMK